MKNGTERRQPSERHQISGMEWIDLKRRVKGVCNDKTMVDISVAFDVSISGL
jgi:hypothetical protein